MVRRRPPGPGEEEDDSSLGFTTVVEGDAVRIQKQYVASLPAKDRTFITKAEAKQSSGLDPKIPEVLKELIYFPYLVGPTFTAGSLVRTGGQSRLDAAFKRRRPRPSS